MTRIPRIVLLLALMLPLVSGCGALFGTAEEPTPTPTKTPTSQASASELVELDVLTATPEATATLPATVTAIPPTATIAAATEAPADTPTPIPADTPTPLPATATPISRPMLIVGAETINVRQGPGTVYKKIAAAARDQQFELIGRDQSGDWWQVCCFGEQPGWLYGDLVDLQNEETVAVAANIPDPPPATATPEAVAAVEPAPSSLVPGVPPPSSGTAGNLDPSAQYQIVHFKVLGLNENNGGIFNKGGQHHIFLTVLDSGGNGVDGAVVKDAVGDKLNVVTGNKGPGRTEITMDWDPYKLFVGSDPGGPVTSQLSNQMNTAHPHLPDIVGRLGAADNEYAICPTIDDRCTPPFYHAHWSYEITFQKVN